MDHPKDHPLDSHEISAAPRVIPGFEGPCKRTISMDRHRPALPGALLNEDFNGKPSHSKMYLPVRHGDFRFAMLVFGRVYVLAPCVNTGKSMDSEG